MLYTLLLGLLFFQSTPDPYNEVIDQATVYIQNIDTGDQLDENFWGINELYSSNCGNNKTVERLVIQSRIQILQNVFTKHECIPTIDEDSIKHERLKLFALENGSFSTAIHYFTQNESNAEFDQFYKKYFDTWGSNLSSEEIDYLLAVKNRTPLFKNINEILKDPFELYSLLYSDFVNSYFSSDELNEIIKKINLQRNKDHSSLDNSLIYYSLLKAAYDTNQYQFISSIFDQLIESNLYPHSIKKVGVFSGLDYSLSINGNYSESLFLQRNILLPFSKYYSLDQRTDYILLRQSANLYELGKFNEAKIVLEKLYNDPSSSIPKSQLYANLSLCYQKLGEKNKYTSFLLQAIQEMENSNTEIYDYANIKLGLYRNLFVYYNSIGDSSNAISYVNRAKVFAEEQSNDNELAAIHSYLGNYYWKNFKDADKSIEQYNKTQNMLQNNENYRLKRDVLLDISYIYISIDSLEKARSSIKEIKSLASENSDSPFYVEGLIFEGEIAFLKRDLSKLEQTLNEIKAYTLENLEFEVLIRYHHLTASLLHEKGAKREAYSYFKPIMDQIIDRARGSVDAQTGFWTVEEEYLDSFELMISITNGLESIQESISYLDKLKTINDASLYNNPLLRANKLTEKELAEEKKLTSRIQALRNEYLGASSNLQSSLKTEIDKLSAQKQLLVNKVNSTQSEPNIYIWKIQQQMAGDELVIHYTELNDKLYASSISKSSFKIETLELTPDIKNLLTNTANDLASGKTSLLNLFEIYNFLKLNNVPDNISQISVIPDNELYRIPLDVLPTKKPNSSYSFGSAHYLIEDYDFKYFTSLQDYAKNNRNISTNLQNDFSAFAISYFDGFGEKNLPSLPFATQEATEIQDVLTSFKTKKVFSGNGATEQAFQEQLNTSRILHVATHSEVSTQDPLFSTIYLKSAESNGIEGDALYAYELFDNQLNNELIMLNSCSSGTGNYLQGSGIMGISRALRYAGAKSLALNLWEVNDKIASEFATDFYSYLNEGYSKSESMRLAKINQIKTGSADPHFWGAYTLIGNSTPIIKKPTSSQLLLPLLLAVGLLVGYRVRSSSEN